ncbi:RBP protein [Aspergillus saccharolyticus JOP 1030-1]|uniref:RBP protein n=1 Tax=Aspergillus saccharolyticus JOP 1030-1 TaxID=1450539 RepID=A0A318ZHL8_9EURO|nr:RBP protein [Aspergillus saccharolyticus JOP 1030-1]PYH44063.1 RBP protein [Aspergillus saccharolyticus JOP 1030-1]
MQSLPLHPQPIETPSPSEILLLPSGEKGYHWVLSDAERNHIATMLAVEDTHRLTLRGTRMMQDRAICAGCGKHSGLDDLVHNALYGGVHTTQFMLDVLVHGPKANSPGHQIICSGCGRVHDGLFYWIPALTWM